MSQQTSLEQVQTGWSQLMQMIHWSPTETFRVIPSTVIGVLTLNFNDQVFLYFDNGYEQFSTLFDNTQYSILLQCIYILKDKQTTTTSQQFVFDIQVGIPSIVSSELGPYYLTEIRLQVCSVSSNTLLPELGIFSLLILWVPAESVEIPVENFYTLLPISYNYTRVNTLVSIQMNSDYNVQIKSKIVASDTLLNNLPSTTLNQPKILPLYNTLRVWTIQDSEEDLTKKELLYIPNDTNIEHVTGLEAEYVACIYQEKYLVGVQLQIQVQISETNVSFPVFYNKIFTMNELRVWCLLEEAVIHALRVSHGSLYRPTQQSYPYKRAWDPVELKLDSSNLVPSGFTLRCNMLYRYKDGTTQPYVPSLSFSSSSSLQMISSSNFMWEEPVEGIYYIKNVATQQYIRYTHIDPITYGSYVLGPRNSLENGYYSQRFRIKRIIPDQPIYTLQDDYSETYLHIKDDKLCIGGAVAEVQFRFVKLSSSAVGLVTWSKGHFSCLIPNAIGIEQKPMTVSYTNNTNYAYVLEKDNSSVPLKPNMFNHRIRRWGVWYWWYCPDNAVEDTTVTFIGSDPNWGSHFHFRNLGDNILTIYHPKSKKFCNIGMNTTDLLKVSTFQPEDATRTYWFKWIDGNSGDKSAPAIRNIRNGLNIRESGLKFVKQHTQYSTGSWEDHWHFAT